MYITFNNETKRVVYIGKKKPISISNNLTLAEVEIIPDKYDYLTVVNEREKTDTWKETQEEYNEETSEVTTKEVERSRTYTTCDLIINFKPQPTLEEIEKQKEKRYNELCEKYIRQKYSVSDEFKVLRKQNIDTQAYQEYFDYVEYCLQKAKAEVWG